MNLNSETLKNWLKLESARATKMENAFNGFDFAGLSMKVTNHTTDWLNKVSVPVYTRTVFVEKNGERMTLQFTVEFEHADSLEIAKVSIGIYEFDEDGVMV